MLRTQDNLHTLIDSFANPTKPVTVCSLSAQAGSPKFISLSEIGYSISSSANDPINGLTTIQRMSLKDMKPITVATLRGYAIDVAWSPDGLSVAYLAYTNFADGSNGNQLWLKAGSAAPRAVTPLIPLFGRDGSVNDQTIVRFSHDGKYLLMVDTFIAGAAPTSADQAVIQVHSVPDGKLLWVPPSALAASMATKIDPSVTMAAWSPSSDRLYYRDSAGVHTWNPPTTVGTLASGLAWYTPSVSPDGTLVAYAATINVQPRVEVRNLSDGSIRVLPGMLGQPTLLSSQEMIEAHFVRNSQFGPPYMAAGYFILNLLTNKETPLPGIMQFEPIDTWPH